MRTIAEWLARPFEDEELRRLLPVHPHDLIKDREGVMRELRMSARKAHPIWHARFKLAQWVRPIDPAACVYLAGMLVFIAVEVAYGWVARTLRLRRVDH